MFFYQIETRDEMILYMCSHLLTEKTHVIFLSDTIVQIFEQLNHMLDHEVPSCKKQKNVLQKIRFLRVSTDGMVKKYLFLFYCTSRASQTLRRPNY